MDTPVISVARALDLDVPRAWQEAVAVAVEAGHASASSGRAATAQHCLISAAGGLVLQSAPAPRVSPGAALASLLGELLDGQVAPPELRAFTDTAADKYADDVEGLLAALAYFEPPDRREAVASLARRAIALDAQAESDTELVELRRAAKRKAQVETPAAPAEPPRAKSRPVSVAIAALAWALVAVMLAGWYFSSKESTATGPAVAPGPEVSAGGAAAPPPPASGLVATATAALDRATMAGLRAVGLAAPETESPSPARATPPAPAASATPRRAPRTVPEAPPSAPTDAPAAAAAAAPATPPPADAPRDELPTRAAEPADAVSPPPPTPVFYTGTDSDVEAPVLVYPQLPTDAAMKPVGADVDHFELLINESGIVERVRLLARQPRFQDRMMVSAAKAWRFQPATRDGRPVRYLLRVPTASAAAPER